MLKDYYNVRVSENVDAFEFDSTGPKGSVRKVVRYVEINLKGFYNLGFGDLDEQTGYISDITITTAKRFWRQLLQHYTLLSKPILRQP